MAKHDNMQIKVFIIMVFKDYEAILMQFDSVYKMLNTEKKTDIHWNVIIDLMSK